MLSFPARVKFRAPDQIPIFPTKPYSIRYKILNLSTWISRAIYHQAKGLDLSEGGWKVTYIIFLSIYLNPQIGNLICSMPITPGISPLIYTSILPYLHNVVNH